MEAADDLLAAVKRGDVKAAEAALDGGARRECADKSVRRLLACPALRAAPARSRRPGGGAWCGAHAVAALRATQFAQTPLSVAVQKGHADLVEKLLKKGAFVNTTDVVREPRRAAHFGRESHAHAQRRCHARPQRRRATRARARAWRWLRRLLAAHTVAPRHAPAGAPRAAALPPCTPRVR